MLRGSRAKRGEPMGPPLSALPPVTVVGCHGGCGATTVARLLAPVGQETTRDQLHLLTTPVVLVARSTAYGMSWATRGVTVAHQGIGYGRVPGPPVLVLVADSPLREPATVRARVRLLQDRVRSVVRMPYVPEWRDTDDPLTVPPSKSLIEAVAALRSALAVRSV
ncbi:hypothetical protein H3146_03950 [Streptomyces sp. OF3]|uniref:Uncharacterized protein n=1 Tax=Streptomyces alkaliterrae TaxID=2213162 RepID=A0A7W3WHL5_9ACTN|nr:hypothetical protein [Streptomyces alkaliterrae]MBB1252528.1 hypothetical protein [Streptomyces alkaliterrae]